jgi:hypothetical protein
VVDTHTQDHAGPLDVPVKQHDVGIECWQGRLDPEAAAAAATARWRRAVVDRRIVMTSVVTSGGLQDEVGLLERHGALSEFTTDLMEGELRPMLTTVTVTVTCT